MPNALACPQISDLEKFLLGLLAAVEAERTQQHVASCPSCLDTLHRLESSDTLVEAMRAQVRRAERSEDAIVAGLIAKLDGLQPLAVEQVATVAETARERPGTCIGPYRLVEEIGEGGFGVVFLAEQREPIRRQVALKIVKPGMDTRRVIARFEAERQALAVMNHANIAKVLDAGATKSGRPYFVMELVRGVPITAYCDEHRLPIRERLTLFASVCQAIQHAHTKGIIHRDIKPSNVLAAQQDGQPQVKVIDFGIAKALGPPLADQTQCTGLAQMIGTPLYMSPEQAGQSGLDIDTRTDVFSLGVLLYELLTGTTPIEKQRFKQAPLDEIRRILREEEPERPSLRLARIRRVGSAHQDSEATGGHSPPYAPVQRLSELDWIVMKCLEKDRSRRYETASGLALDVQRYLADEPVLACPPSAGYRLGKFARRHRAALVGTAVIAVGLLTAAVALAVGNVRVNAALAEKSSALTQRTIALSAETQAKRTLQDTLAREQLTVYEQRIELADREWLDGNVAQALALLDSCQQDLRDWEWRYLRRRCNSDGFSFAAALGLQRLGWSGTLSPDGKVAAIYARGQVHFLDTLTGRAIQAPAEFDLPLGLRIWDGGFKFLQNGKRLALSPQGKVVIWDIGVARTILEFPLGDKQWLRAINHDGSRLVAGAEQGAPVLLDGRSGERVHEFTAHAYARAAFGANGRLVLASGPTVSIHDAETGNKLFAFQHFCNISAVAYHAAQRLVVAGDELGNVGLWTEDGRMITLVRYRERGISTVAISPDAAGRWVAWEGASDQTVKVSDWRQQSDPMLHQYHEVQVLRGHSADPTSRGFYDLAFLDAERLVAVSKDGALRHWNVAAGQQHRVLRGHLTAPLEFGGAGGYLLADNALLEAKGLTRVFTVPGPRERLDDVTPDGKYAISVAATTNPVSAATTTHLKVWDVAAVQTILSLDGGSLSSVRISSDGRSLAMARADGSLRLRDLESGQEVLLRNAAEKPEPFVELAFSRDGKCLAGVDKSAHQLWDLSAGPARLVSVAGRFRCPVFSADNRYVAAIRLEGGVTLWDATSGQARLSLPTGPGTTSIAFSPSGERLVSLSRRDGRLRIWNTKTGHSPLALEAPAGTHREVVFSPDGNWVAACGQGGLWIWDGTPGKIEDLRDIRDATKEE